MADRTPEYYRANRQRSPRVMRSRRAFEQQRRDEHEKGVAQQSDWRTARDFFAREVARADYNHEFHFWLGLADWQLGDIAQARKHLQLAIDNSTTRGQHDLYAAKLAWLQSRQKPEPVSVKSTGS